MSLGADRPDPIDMIGIGAQKAGTTSLWATLRHQPWFTGAQTKELHYFNFNHHRGVTWYRDQFPPPAPGRVRGEITPDYLRSRAAPLRMYRYNPRLRLVAILRNPVDRALSAFLHARRLGAIPRSRTFEEALALETPRYGSPWSDLVEGGLYFRQLLRFREHFPPEQLHVALFEELTDPSHPALEGTIEFIAGPGMAISPVRHLHRNPFRPGRLPRVQRNLRAGARLVQRSGFTRSGQRLNAAAVKLLGGPQEQRPEMDRATRALLLERFAPENAALATLLGKDLRRWER